MEGKGRRGNMCGRDAGTGGRGGGELVGGVP